MVSYKCIYCQKKYDHKNNFNNHQKNIDLCKDYFERQITKYKNFNKINTMTEIISLINILKNKNINQILSYNFYKKIDEKNDNSLKICTIDISSCYHNKKNNLDQKYICNICDKEFKNENSLFNHTIKQICKKNNISKTNNNSSNNLTNNNINSHNTSNVTSNITSNIKTQNNNTQNNYNINNNIKLVPYDDIKYDFMKPSVLKDAFEVPGEAFQSITADTFFDPENKENHVIYCPNLKDTQIHVYNGNKFSADGWDVVEKKDFFKQMLTNQIRTLEKIKRCNDLDENPLEINNIVGFANLLKEFNANNDVIKEYTTKLNTLCWKNNPIVKKTKEESKEIKIQKMIQKALAN